MKKFILLTFLFITSLNSNAASLGFAQNEMEESKIVDTKGLRSPLKEVMLDRDITFYVKTSFFSNDWSGNVTIYKWIQRYYKTNDDGVFYIAAKISDFSLNRLIQEGGVFFPFDSNKPILTWTKKNSDFTFGANPIELNDGFVRDFKNQIIVTSTTGNPIGGSIILLAPANGKDFNSICTTNERGICEIGVKASPLEKITVQVRKDGIFPKTLSFINYLADINKQTTRNISVEVIDDYLCQNLKSSGQTKFTDSLGYFVGSMMIGAKFQHTILAKEGICLVDFKQKKYISLTLEHDFVFNEIKLTNYVIGATVFDEVIRKILDRLAAYKSDYTFDGYDVSIRTSKTNFVDKSSLNKTLVYRFYLPKKTVQNYKEKDISGQQLLDDSIILLDDERIDIKLQ